MIFFLHFFLRLPKVLAVIFELSLQLGYLLLIDDVSLKKFTYPLRLLKNLRLKRLNLFLLSFYLLVSLL